MCGKIEWKAEEMGRWRQIGNKMDKNQNVKEEKNNVRTKWILKELRVGQDDWASEVQKTDHIEI